MTSEEEIFKQGSTTYYWSSRFFPPATRRDVLRLYSFVRVADNFVDSVPQDLKNYQKLIRTWAKISTGKKVRTKKGDIISQVCNNMYEVATKYEFEPEWTEAFLASMSMDAKGRTYKTMDDTLEYIYGSAEVIGLMMAKIMGVKPEAYKYAKLQARAMQYINFIRDIDEDIKLGRRYFAKKELDKYGLPRLTFESAQKHPAAYREFFEAQLRYYTKWQTQANKGFKSVPRRQRIALRTAVDMYNWTAAELAKDPFVVFDKKVKPSKFRVVARAVARSMHA